MQPAADKFILQGPTKGALALRTKSLSILTLVAAFALSLEWSLRLGPDSNWDMLIYHYSNGAAVVSGRIWSDIAPNGMLNFSNPLFDIPSAIAMNISHSYVPFMVWMAIVQTLCWVSVWRLTEELFVKFALRAFATGLAVFAPLAYSVSFTTFDDWIVAGFVCEGLRLLLKLRRISAEADSQRPINKHRLSQCASWSGVLFGIAVAVKLTAVDYVIVALLFVIVFLPRQTWFRWFAGATVSFLATSVPWMLFLYVRYGSPLFPYFNGIFKADSASVRSFDDPDFGAHGIVDLIMFPYRMLRGTNLYAEIYLRDWRPAALVFLVAISAVVKRHEIRSSMFRPSSWPPRVAALAFCIGAYLIWAVQFGIYRYFLPVEVIGSILVVAFLEAVIGSLVESRPRLRSRSSSLAVLVAIPAALVLVVSLATSQFSSFSLQTTNGWGRKAILHQPKWPTEIRDSLLILRDNTFSYSARTLPRSTRLSSVVGFDSGRFNRNGTLWNRLGSATTSAQKAGGVFVLQKPDDQPSASLTALGLVVDVKSCQPFALYRSGLGLPQAELCSAKPGRR